MTRKAERVGAARGMQGLTWYAFVDRLLREPGALDDLAPHKPWPRPATLPSDRLVLAARLDWRKRRGKARASSRTVNKDFVEWASTVLDVEARNHGALLSLLRFVVGVEDAPEGVGAELGGRLRAFALERWSAELPSPMPREGTSGWQELVARHAVQRVIPTWLLLMRDPPRSAGGPLTSAELSGADAGTAKEEER